MDWQIFAMIYVCGVVTGGLVVAVLADELVSRERERMVVLADELVSRERESYRKRLDRLPYDADEWVP